MKINKSKSEILIYGEKEQSKIGKKKLNLVIGVGKLRKIEDDIHIIRSAKVAFTS